VTTSTVFFRLYLPDEAATMALGVHLARSMTELKIFPALLLRGELGAGKTTLVRGLVGALPGGDQAEVSSPSFNYMNCYPTQPETSHFDFYRLQHCGIDDELLEAMHDAGKLVLVEWAEFCPETHSLQERLEFQFSPVSSGRQLVISGQGNNALRLLEKIQKDMALTRQAY